MFWNFKICLREENAICFSFFFKQDVFVCVLLFFVFCVFCGGGGGGGSVFVFVCFCLCVFGFGRKTDLQTVAMVIVTAHGHAALRVGGRRCGDITRAMSP